MSGVPEWITPAAVEMPEVRCRMCGARVPVMVGPGGREYADLMLTTHMRQVHHLVTEAMVRVIEDDARRAGYAEGERDGRATRRAEIVAEIAVERDRAEGLRAAAMWNNFLGRKP